MKKIIQNVIYMCLGLFFCSFTNASEYNLKPENIRVLLDRDISEALLEVCGPYYIFNPSDGSKISSGILGKRFIIRSTPSGIKWGQEYPGTHQIVIVPKTENSKILLNGIQYSGAIAVYKVNNKLNLINEIDIESYLKSTLNQKFPQYQEPEAMAAIAISERTTAYFQAYKNKNSFWDVDAKAINYNGSALILNDSIATKAINDTKHLILLNKKENISLPFMASWTEHSGGKTAAYHTIFRKETNSPANGVEAPLAAIDRKETRYSSSISIEKFSYLFGLSKVNDIELFQDPNSQKVYAVRLKENNNQVDLNFFSFQEKLGKKFLKSNDFTFFIREGEIHFIGYGRGHGVGLCLYSASSMAQNGDTAVKILSKFFPDTFIVNLSAGLKQK